MNSIKMGDMSIKPNPFCEKRPKDERECGCDTERIVKEDYIPEKQSYPSSNEMTVMALMLFLTFGVLLFLILR